MLHPPLYFLHIPKTAGTSLVSYLDRQFAPEEICDAQLLPPLFALSHEALQACRFFKGHLWYGLPGYVGQPMRYITMLRDPVERTISWYAHVKRDANAHRHEQVVGENWSLLDFVRDAATNWDMINAQTLFLAVDLDYERLSRDPDGYGRDTVRDYASRMNDPALLETAKQRLEDFAFVGVTEHMQQSLDLLAYTMGWQPAESLPLLNVSANRPELTPETLAAIQDITRLDQALYDWARGRFEARYQEMVRSLVSGHASALGRGLTLPWHAVPLPVAAREGMRVQIVHCPDGMEVNALIDVTVEVTNLSCHWIVSAPPHPVHLCYHWISAGDGAVVVFDGRRTAIRPGVATGHTMTCSLAVEAPPEPGAYILRVTLVQEGVAWFDEAPTPMFHDHRMQVGEKVCTV